MTRKPVDGNAVGIMAVLCLIWAFQQILLKAAAPDVAPVLQIAIRSGVAAVLVWLLMLWRNEKIDFKDGTWRPGLLVGVLFALEFLFVGEGLRYTHASHMAVFLYTAPFFAALGLHLKLPEERLQVGQWAGIALAFLGIVIAFAGRGPDAGASKLPSANILFGDFYGLVAGACWGATTVVIRCSSLSNIPATKTLLYQLVGAVVILAVATLGLGQTHFNSTPLAWGSILFQALIVSFVSFLVWFWLLRKYLASSLGVFSFMTPLFGVILGVWLLDEQLDVAFGIGAALVVCGIILVSGWNWISRWPAFRRQP